MGFAVSHAAADPIHQFDRKETTMTLPLLTLLGFAAWMLVLLAATVGVHRWSLILTKRARVNAFPADAPTGPGWYQRATRAHMNCVENLPVYGAIILVATL